ncbi:cold shock domain-containing protein [Streptomyces sp. NPDC059698]
MPQGERCKGTVIYFDRNRGCGFVVQHGHQDQIFVQRESIESPVKVLSEGQSVTFKLTFLEGRWEATQVQA